MKEKYMERALELSKKAIGRTSPNPLVGAVIVKEGKIVGEGYHKKAGLPHAERIALNNAGTKAKDADLYVTLEPCNHTGRTPPCTEAIIEAGIKNVYVATLDPNPLVKGLGIKRLKNAGINVEIGLKEKDALKVNEVFFKYIKTKLPFIVLKGACSLDGKIATSTGESKWITSEKAREHSHSLRNIYDAIMVGKGTILADDPLLTCRIPEGRDPIRIIVDSKLSIPLDAKILNLKSEAKTIIATTTKASLEKRKELSKKAEIIMAGDNQVDLLTLFKILGEKEITSILVEGGATLSGSLLTNNLVDKLYLYLAPMIIGGEKAKGFVGGEGFKSLQDAVKLENLTIDHLDSDFLLTGTLESKEENDVYRIS